MYVTDRCQTNASLLGQGDNNNEKVLRETQTLHVLAVERFGHRPPARCHKPTDRTDYNTLRHSWLAHSVIIADGCCV